MFDIVTTVTFQSVSFVNALKLKLFLISILQNHKKKNKKKIKIIIIIIIIITNLPLENAFTNKEIVKARKQICGFAFLLSRCLL